MSYLRGLLVGLWLIIASIVGLFIAIIRFRNLNCDRWISRTIAWGFVRVAGIQIEAFGLEHLESQKPCIYVSNHQGAMDMAVYGVNYPYRTIVIGKRELLWIPFFGLVFYAAGNILIDRKNKQSARSSIQLAVERIRQDGASIWIMPEGTRNRSGDALLPFKKGAFHMAIEAQVPLVPVVASSFKKMGSLESGRLSPVRVQLRVLPPIETHGLTMDDLDRLAEEVREKMSEAFRSLQTRHP